MVELDGGVRVVGPNSGWSLSFLAEAGATARYLAAPAAGSQFRSRDFVPQAIGRLMAGDLEVVGEPVPADGVPPVPDGALAYADGYGNLKTTWQGAPVATGERVLVRIGHASSTAVVSDGTFEVADGELSFAPGSSGWTTLDGSARPLYELLLRGGSAAARMGHPPSGASVDLSPA